MCYMSKANWRKQVMKKALYYRIDNGRVPKEDTKYQFYAYHKI